MSGVDARCDEHVGEVHLPRCDECERLQREEREASTSEWAPLGVVDDWGPW